MTRALIAGLLAATLYAAAGSAGATEAQTQAPPNAPPEAKPNAQPGAAARPAAPRANAKPLAKAPAKPPAKPAPKPSARLPAQGPAYADRPDAVALADSLAAAQGLDAGWVRTQIARARFVPAVPRLIMPPPAGTAKNWAAYRARFIEPDRLKAGAAFWREHERWLAAAETRYGVPSEIVVGVIGVETFYGRILGDFRVLDALATLSLDFPSGRSDRSPFFREELGHFLKLAQVQGFDPASVRGSFAGAMGLGQFMPGSINRHAVDFDGDGHIDMAGSAADVIGSVANYLARHGWQPGLATHYAVKPPVDSRARATLLGPDILPSFSAAQMAELGAELDDAGRAHTGPLALVELQNGDAAPSYVAGTQNFYAVTRYNWSSYYALAVIELGRAVARQRDAAASPRP